MQLRSLSRFVVPWCRDCEDLAVCPLVEMFSMAQCSDVSWTVLVIFTLLPGLWVQFPFLRTSESGFTSLVQSMGFNCVCGGLSATISHKTSVREVDGLWRCYWGHLEAGWGS